jgi:hypothetical protein
MHLKSFVSALILFVSLCLPASAQTYDLNNFLGTYVSNSSPDYVGVKRLTITKEATGKLKVRATISAFPDDVYLGEATAEPYTCRPTEAYRSLLSTFSAGKLSVLMVVVNIPGAPEDVITTTYVKYTDSSKPNAYFESRLQKEPEKPAK